MEKELKNSSKNNFKLYNIKEAVSKVRQPLLFKKNSLFWEVLHLKKINDNDTY